MLTIIRDFNMQYSPQPIYNINGGMWQIDPLIMSSSKYNIYLSNEGKYSFIYSFRLCLNLLEKINVYNKNPNSGCILWFNLTLN